MTRARVRTWLRRWVQNPIASCILIGALVWSMNSLDRGWPGLRGDGAFVPSFRERPSDRSYSCNWFALRNGGTFRILDPDNDSWDETTRLIAQRSPDLFRISCLAVRTDEGVYALTGQARFIDVRIIKASSAWDSGEPADEPDARVIRATFVDRFCRELPTGADRDFEYLLKSGQSGSHRVIWSGYLHNTLALLGLLLFLYSLAWIPRVGPYLTRSRAQRRLARGCCPHCNYSIAGLPEPVCPECGKGWNITAEDDIPISSSTP